MYPFLLVAILSQLEGLYNAREVSYTSGSSFRDESLTSEKLNQDTKSEKKQESFVMTIVLLFELPNTLTDKQRRRFG